MKWIFWYAAFLHVVWAALFLLSPDALATTPTARLDEYLGGRYGACAVMIAASALAAREMTRDFQARYSILWMLPQQVVLLLSGIGACSAVLRGTYADGVPRPRAFIFADQYPMILAVLFHSAALIFYYGGGPIRLMWPCRTCPFKEA